MGVISRQWIRQAHHPELCRGSEVNPSHAAGVAHTPVPPVAGLLDGLIPIPSPKRILIIGFIQCSEEENPTAPKCRLREVNQSIAEIKIGQLELLTL